MMGEEMEKTQGGILRHEGYEQDEFIPCLGTALGAFTPAASSQVRIMTPDKALWNSRSLRCTGLASDTKFGPES